MSDAAADSTVGLDLGLYLEDLCSGLVAEPDLLKVTTEHRGETIFLHMDCAKADVGRLIGKGGRTAHAVRTLTLARAAMVGASVKLVFPE